MTASSAKRDSLLLRRVSLIRFLLPLLLFGVVTSYEVWEHWILEGVIHYDFNLTSEVMFFGVLGPAAVFAALSYIGSLLRRQMQIAGQLETLNATLEENVAERTEALAARNSELAAANAKLQKLDQMKSDFVSLVSHELRAPLTTLNGGLELALQETVEMTPDSRRILEVMRRESAHLTGLVKTILDVSQLDAGKLTLNPGPVAAIPLLYRAAESSFSGEERPIHWQFEPDLPPLWADETYTEEIVRNLLHNAHKHTPPDSPIEISARSVEDTLEISISDHGPGIPPELADRIFERFYRRQERDRVSSAGWGLGLHFARALAQAQGGSLTVTSPVHPERQAPGAKFTLRLPVTAEVPEDGETAAD